MKTVNGTLEHTILGFGAMLISLLLHHSLWPAIWGLIFVELTQLESDGLKNVLKKLKESYLDTGHDLLMDAIGAGAAFLLYFLVTKYM